jgi:RimJ/RimL family protein N-acetyltransferase
MTSPADARIELRRAVMDDAARLLAWRNDAETVRFSGTQRTVAIDEHQRWLHARLEQSVGGIWIGEVDGHPVGNVRVDETKLAYEVHIVVAPEERGRGHGLALIRAVQAQAIRGGMTPLLARVDPDNTRSLVMFRRCGFIRRGRSGRLLSLWWKP